MSAYDKHFGTEVAIAAMAIFSVVVCATGAVGQPGRTQPEAQQVTDAMGELGDPNPRVREKAADKLEFIARRCKDDAILVPAVGRLTPLMDDDDLEVRDETAEVLGIIASRIQHKAAVKSAIAALIKGLSDYKGQVREESAEALARIASAIQDKVLLNPAVEPLKKALGDNPATEAFAEQALRRLGKKTATTAVPTKPLQAKAGATLYNGIELPATWPPKRKALKRVPMSPPYLRAPPKVIPIDVGRQLLVGCSVSGL
jgi:hypothetical protein